MQPAERDTLFGNLSGTETNSRLEASSSSNSSKSIDQVESRSTGCMQTCTCDFRLSQHSPVTLMEEMGSHKHVCPYSFLSAQTCVSLPWDGALPYMARARCYLIPSSSCLTVGTAHKTISFGPGRSGYGCYALRKRRPNAGTVCAQPHQGRKSGRRPRQKLN